MINHDLAKQLYSRMAGAVFPRDIQGTCEIQLADGAEAFSAYISYYDHALSYSENMEKAPDAAVRMRPETLSHILSTTDQFDLRNPDILMQVSAEGNLALANFLFTLVKRPSQQIENLIRQTEALAACPGPGVTEIKRVHKPSEAEVVRLIAASVPFVITGAMEDWPFLSKGFSALKKEYGDVQLRPDLVKGNGVFETLKDFIEKMESSRDPSVYTFGCPLPLALWAEIPLPYFDWDSLTSPQIWMGRKTGEKPCTTLHRDCNHGMLANLQGRKKLVFFSPDQSHHLYPIKAFNSYQPCEVGDVKDVDLNRFPRFVHARPVEVTVMPGEILIIPAFWYHCVYALDDVFSISFALLWNVWDTLKNKN
jgi:hypothetical protein